MYRHSWSFVNTNSPYENICEVLQIILDLYFCVDGWGNLTLLQLTYCPVLKINTLFSLYNVLLVIMIDVKSADNLYFNRTHACAIP